MNPTTQFQFEGTSSQEEAEKLEQVYKGFHDQLQTEAAPFYVSNQMWQQTTNGKYFSVSTWSSFIPTILPETNYVMIVLAEKFSSRVYVISQEKLISLLEDKVQSVDTPAKYYILSPITDNAKLQNAVLQAVTLIKSETRFENLEGVTSPSTKKYFIKLLIHSFSGMSEEEKVYLSFHQQEILPEDQMPEIYCSKVNVGQTLEEVLEKEMLEITGSNKFNLIGIQEDGTDFDRHGNELPRYAINVLVPYFDTVGRTLQGMHMSWRTLTE